MREYRVEILLGLVVLVCSSYLLLKWQSKPPPKSTCGGPLVTIQVPDDTMAPILKSGASVKILTNWNGCYELTKGDLVAFKISASHDPVVKRLEAMAGDVFRIERSEDKSGWNVFVNNTLLERNGKPYKFGSPALPLLKIYQEKHQGLLDQNAILLFSETPPGDQDSGTLGVVNVQDLLGPVVLGPDSSRTGP
ncbi:MAG: S26 family signal peptidase [Bdellovibrionales bacterium]